MYGDSMLENDKDLLAIKIKLENNVPLTDPEIELAVTNELETMDELTKPPPKEPKDDDKEKMDYSYYHL